MPLNPDKVIPDTRMYLETDNGKKQPLFNHIIAVITLIMTAGWYHILGLLLITSYFFITPRYILLILMLSLLHDPEVYNRNFLNSIIFKYWREYFSYSVIFETLELNNMPLIFGEFPHGVIPLGQILAQSIMERYIGRPTFSVTVKSALLTPGWKHLLTYCGCLEATKENILYSIDQEKNMAIILGGVAEMFRSEVNRDVIVLKRRKGFVKIAIERGLGLVPVYYFGQAQLFDFGPKFLEPLSRKYRTSIGIHYNSYLIPLPRQVEIMCVVGSVIPTKKTSPDDPNFTKYVDEIHQKFINEMNRLYDKYKGIYGYKDNQHPLIIE